MVRKVPEPTWMRRITVTLFLLTVLAPFAASAQECGSTWTHVMRYYPGTQAFYAVANNGSMFVVVGHGDVTWTSMDGVNWTQGTQIVGGPLYEVTYAQGKFVAVGWHARILTSTDGLNWIERDSNIPALPELFALVYDPDLGQFVTAGGNGYGATSSDGVNWTSFQHSVLNFRSMVYKDGLYAASSGQGRVGTSTNGRTWSYMQIAPTDKALMCSALGNVGGVDTYMVGGESGLVYTSTNPTNASSWTLRTTPVDYGYLWGATWTGTHFIIVGQKGTPYAYCPVMTSPNGIDWTLRNSQATECQWLFNVDFMRNDSISRIVAVGHVGNIVRSECAFEPYVTVHPQNASPCLNGSAQFCVTAVGYPPLTYQWQRYVTSTWQNMTGAQSSCYTINPVQASHPGQYRCQIQNTYGTVYSNAATLTVRVAPVISQHPQNQAVCEFESVQFGFTLAQGSTPLSYQWQRNLSGSWENAPNGTLNTCTINSVDTSDAGQYRCQVSNNCASVTSNAATLTVTARAKPDFDCDQDVDQEDFGQFQKCLSGGGVSQNDPICVNARLDSDDDVDVDDFTRFLNCMRGANVPAELDCAD